MSNLKPRRGTTSHWIFFRYSSYVVVLLQSQIASCSPIDVQFDISVHCPAVCPRVSSSSGGARVQRRKVVIFVLSTPSYSSSHSPLPSQSHAHCFLFSRWNNARLRSVCKPVLSKLGRVAIEEGSRSVTIRCMVSRRPGAWVNMAADGRLIYKHRCNADSSILDFQQQHPIYGSGPGPLNFDFHGHATFDMPLQRK